MTSTYKFWKLSVLSDARGSLCAVDKKDLPFVPKRIYFLFGVSAIRGAHAHMKEREVFVCIRGTFRARIHDGRRWLVFQMKQPGQALYTDKMVWHEFDNFTKDAVMLAITDTTYQGQKGYILDFKQFRIIASAARQSK